MNRFTSRFVSMFFATTVLAMAIPTMASAASTLNVGASSTYQTIDAAMSAAVDGDTIQLDDTNYTLTNTLEVNKSVTINGNGEVNTTIDTSAVSGYGVHSAKSNIAFSNFTLVGPLGGSGRYGFKIEGLDINTKNSNISFNDITVRDSGRTGFDLNGVSNVTFTNVTATNNGGNGISITDGDNVTFTNVSTSGNSWGGVAIYTKGVAFPGGSNNINVTGLTASEANPFYVELAGVDPMSSSSAPFQFTGLTAPQYGYTGHNNSSVPLSAYTWYNDDATELAGWIGPVSGSFVTTTTGNAVVTGSLSIQQAIDNATAGDTILITGTTTLTTTVNVNKSVILKGAAGAAIVTSGGNQLFTITAPNVTIQDIAFVKTDKTTQSIIGVQAANITISGNSFVGQYVIGDNEVSRAIIVSPGTVNVQILNNSINAFRQPAYIDQASGNITNNYVNGTKGWVIVADATIVFTGNSWGTNVLDIAVIPASTNNYTDIVTISSANNNAAIENQFGVPSLSTVYVDASVVTSGNGIQSSPYKTISEAIPRVTTGGTIIVKAGTYTEQITLNKNLILIGDSLSTTFIQAPSIMATGTLTKKSIVEVNNNSTVTVSNITVTGPGASGCASIDYGFYVVGGATLNLATSSVTNIQDTPFSGCQNGRAVRIGEGAQTGTATINNVTVSGYQKSGIFVDGTGSSATITNSTITGVGSTAAIAQNGITFFSGAVGTITGNTITGNIYTGANSSVGILLYNQGANVIVKNNTSTGNQIGVSIVGTTPATITENDLSNNLELGLETEVTTDATLNFWGSVADPITFTGGLDTGTLAIYSPWYTDMSRSAVVGSTSTVSNMTQETFYTTISRTATSSNLTVVVDMPSSLVLKGDLSWNGVFTLPVITRSFTLTSELGEILTSLGAVELGAGNTSLSLDQAVKITFVGLTGKFAGWSQNGVFHKITSTCTSAVTPVLAADADCSINVGGDMVIWTKHASTFIAYDRTTYVVTVGGFSSGGSSNSGPIGQVLGASTTTVATDATTTIATTTQVMPISIGQVLGVSMFNFLRNLRLGSRGNDVVQLQNMLAKEGFFKVTSTGYFGPITRAAVKKWQAKYGVIATGYFGPISRGQYNKNNSR